MIEAITNIPIEILERVLEEDPIKINDKQEFLVVFLRDNFEIEKIEKKTFDDILKENELSALQKRLIEKFNKYRGIVDFQKYLNRYSIGGNQALATCSLLHFDFSKEGGTITNNLFKKKSNKNIENIKKSFNDKKKKYFNLLNENLDLKESFEKILQNLFLNIILNEKRYKEFNYKYNKYKIVLIPKNDEYIKKFNSFFENFVNIQKGFDSSSKFQRFNIDTFSSNNTRELGILFSKFGKNEDKKINFQTEENNLIKTEHYIKIDKFKRILSNNKKILPLPMFKANKNIYNICFSNYSLLEKLKEIYKKYNKSFNYILVSNFEGYRFENIINFNFNTEKLINKEIYDLNFNKYKIKKEIKEYHIKNRRHDKYELLFDMVFLFWKLNNEENIEISFFKNKSIIKKEKNFKNNYFLIYLFIKYQESIINQIFKQNNSFINFKLQKLINEILDGILKTKKFKERYESLYQIKNLLLIALKYGKGGKKMIDKTKEIEEKLDEFKKTQEIKEIKNDFEAYYYAGILINNLLKYNSSEKSILEIMTKNLISVNNIKQLKNKIIDLYRKYSYNFKVNSKMWDKLNNVFLKYKFEDNKVKDNLIPLYIGFYSNFNFKKTN
jgi:hypothetical protein